MSKAYYFGTERGTVEVDGREAAPLEVIQEADSDKLEPVVLGNNWGIILSRRSVHDGGQPIAYDSMAADEAVVGYEDSPPPNLEGTLLTFTETGQRSSTRFPDLNGLTHAPGEIQPIISDLSDFAEPSPEKLAQCVSIWLANSSLNYLPGNAKAERFLGYFQDQHLPENTPQEDTDYGWRLRYGHKAFGGEPQRGYYTGRMPMGDSHAENWKYNGLFWLAWNYALAPSQAKWNFLMEQAIHHCCYGIAHERGYAGMSRWPKSTAKTAMIGDSQSPRLSKQFDAGLFFIWHLTDSPFFKVFIDEKVRWLLSMDAKDYWPAYLYGARVGARPLHTLILACLFMTGELQQDLMTKLREVVDYFRAGYDESKNCWPNLANGEANYEKDTSPWMQDKLKGLMLYASRFVLHDSELTSWLCQKFSDGYHDKRWWTSYGDNAIVAYRLGGPEADGWKPERNAWTLSCLRHMAEVRGDIWPQEYEDMLAFCERWIGSYVADLTKDMPRPLNQIGYHYGTGGPAWGVKGVRFYLEGFLW